MLRRKPAPLAAAAASNANSTQTTGQKNSRPNSLNLEPMEEFSCPGPVAAQLNAVSKVFPNPNPKLPPLPPALDSVSACIPEGSITGVVGPDAAGKTTLMRLFAGLLQPSSGQVLVLGKTAMAPGGGSLPEVGYMPQRFGLYEDLSVFDNLKLHAQLRNLEGAAREQMFEKLLSFTDLKRFQNRLAGKLSGGMKQKLGLACALLGTPRLLLLDEPGVGVDPESRRELWSMVTTLASDGMSILWSTAYIEEAERCPHVLVLAEGHLIYQGDPATFTKRVENRVFYVTGLPETLPSAPVAQAAQMVKPNPREILLYWSAQAPVRDALVQGSKVRVVWDNTTPQPAALFTPTPPRLEDAYMDAMGGIGKNPSPFLSFESLYAASVPQQPGSGLAELQKKPVIVADSLTKCFGSFVAARDISFNVEQGKIFGLLGPNGAGKSTTFRMLCGLSKPTKGECFVAGVNLLRSGSQARSQLGYMAQKFSLYQDLTLHQNIDLFARLYGIAPKLRDERLALLVEALELEDYLHRQAKDLPLGQRQRLALLCATIHNPKALFLDEPTSGVDPRTRRDFWKHINALTKQGVAVLVTTHFMEEAEYCDEIALIYRGAMIATGSPDSLKAQCPKNSTADPNDQALDPTLEDAFIAYIHAYNENPEEKKPEGEAHA